MTRRSSSFPRSPYLVMATLALSAALAGAATVERVVPNTVTLDQTLVAEGRIGGRTTHELVLGPDTANRTGTNQQGELTWVSGQPVPLTLRYDAGAGLVTFTAGSAAPLEYSLGAGAAIADLLITARAYPAGSRVRVGDLILDGVPLDEVAALAVSGGIDAILIGAADLDDGFELTATATMDFAGITPAPKQSHMTFQLAMGAVPPPTTTTTAPAPPTTSSTTTTLPQPPPTTSSTTVPVTTSTTTSTTTAPAATSTTTSTTRPDPTTTSTIPASTTTTTTRPIGDATLAKPPVAAAEVCGDCRDNDGDGLVDFEDADCCPGGTDGMQLAVRIRPRKGGAAHRVRVRTRQQLFGADPTRDDVSLQLRDDAGLLYCATIPAEQWTRNRTGRRFRFRDPAATTSERLTRARIKAGRNATVRFRGFGATVALPAPAPGALRATFRVGDQCRRSASDLQQRGRVLVAR